MRKRRKVAVILQLWQNYDRGVLSGVAAYVRERRNWSVFVEEVEHQRIPNLREWDGDGLIINFDNRSVAQAVQGIAKPVVALGGGRGWYDETSGFPYVSTDDEAIGRLAAEHLLERGLKQFAFCGYPPNRSNAWVAKRAAGFIGRLAQDGFACKTFQGRYATAQHWERLQAELVAWLRRLPLPIGLLGCYDYRARHVLEACRTAGLMVPEDVAVIGVDNDLVCDLADPPLTSVEQGRFQIGYTAASLLDKLMDKKPPAKLWHFIAPVGVVSRQSTDLIYVADREVAQALRIIRLEASRGVQPDAIAARLQLSRSTLDKRFKSSIGRPVDAEIRRVRLERALDLLARADLPLRKVAHEAGFANEQYMSAVIGKACGCTPLQYREEHRPRGAGIVV